MEQLASWKTCSMIKERYLGDGAYIAYEPVRQMYKIYTTNGIVETNVIWLEDAVASTLLEYLKDELPTDNGR